MWLGDFMDYTFRVTEDDIAEAIMYAKEYTKKDGNQAWLAFGEDGLKPVLDEDSIRGEGKWGDVFLPFGDITTEMLIEIIDSCPVLVDKELLSKVVHIFLEHEVKAKD